MSLEIETKLRLPDERTLEKLKSDAAIAAMRMDEPRDIQMRAVYYDTPGHTLDKRKWTLRLRTENGQSIGTFKSIGTNASGLFSREEYSCLADTLDGAVEQLVMQGAPEELRSMGPFAERCAVNFTRTACSLQLPDGAVCEMALDRGELTAEEKRETLLELELELLTGEPGSMMELAADLTKRYGLHKELYSKYARALKLLRTR